MSIKFHFPLVKYSSSEQSKLRARSRKTRELLTSCAVRACSPARSSILRPPICVGSVKKSKTKSSVYSFACLKNVPFAALNPQKTTCHRHSKQASIKGSSRESQITISVPSGRGFQSCLKDLIGFVCLTPHCVDLQFYCQRFYVLQRWISLKQQL